MIRKVHLLGNLGEKFGPIWNVHCTTVSECLRLIECQTDNFRKHLMDIVDQGTNFSVRTGKELLETGEELFMNVSAEDVYITEVPAGSGGWGKIIVGAILVIAAIAFTIATGGGDGGTTLAAAFGNLGPLQATAVFITASIGLNLIMAGVNELLMPDPQKGKPGGAIFNGPVNTLKQGQPVPLLYGELIIGGAPISVSYTKNAPSSRGITYLELIGASFTGDGAAGLGGVPGPSPTGASSTSTTTSTQPGASFDSIREVNVGSRTQVGEVAGGLYRV